MNDAEDACEMLAGREWVRISLEEALSRFDSSTLKRCIECHGQVRAHRKAVNGMRAHFEHMSAHRGCSLGPLFDGITRLHPKAL